MKILAVSKTIIRNPGGKILLLKRSDSDTRRPGQWDVPGGRVEAGESAEAAGARETAEEAGITVEDGSLVLMYAMTEKPEEDSSVTWLFYGGATLSDEVTLSPEHSEYTWVSLKEAIAMVSYGRQNRALVYIADNNLLSLV